MSSRRAAAAGAGARTSSAAPRRPSRLRETATTSYEEVPSDVDMEDAEARTDEDELDEQDPDDDAQDELEEGEPDEDDDEDDHAGSVEGDDDDDDDEGPARPAGRSSKASGSALAKQRTFALTEGDDQVSPARSRSSRRTIDEDSELSDASDGDEEEEEEEEEEEDELEDGEPDDEEEDELDPSSTSKTTPSRGIKIKLRVSPPTAKNSGKTKWKAAPPPSKKGKKRVVGSEEEGDMEEEDFANADLSARLPKTARQLARDAGESFEPLEALPSSLKSKSKYAGLTETEIASKRSELARRRKNQSDQRLEEEKAETINRLLKKQVTRSRNKLPAAGADGSGDEDERGGEAGTGEGKDAAGAAGKLTREQLKAEPSPMFRYVSRADGSTLSFPPAPFASTSTGASAAGTRPGTRLSSPTQESGAGAIAQGYAKAWRGMFDQSKPVAGQKRRALVQEVP